MPATTLLASLLSIAMALHAQGPSASVVGRITDATAAVIPGAAVRLLSAETNQSFVAPTNENGDYTILNLKPGLYSLEARRDGFHLYRRPEFTLALDQTLRLDFQLEVGATSETITVSDTPPILNTESGARGEVTTNAELTEMPLSGRNFSDLAFLTGGVIPKGEDGDGQYAVNGARADNVGFLLDGMNNTQRRNTGAMISPPLEGVQEFKMVTSGFSAEYGRYAGGLLSVVTKSGGNHLRGALYEFIRNDLADARGFFDPRKGKLRRNQFGVTVTGPVVLPKLYNGRDKTFFLVSWESLRQIAGVSQRGIVPLPEMLTGNFTKATDAYGKPLKITDPLAKALFPGNLIPASRLDPVSKNLGAYYPAPNLTGANNYVTQANSTSDFDNFSIKVDHALTSKDRLSLSTYWRPNTSYNPIYRIPIPTFGSATDAFDLLSGARYTRSLTPTMFLDLNASFSRKTNNWGWAAGGRDWGAGVGFTGGTKNPIAMGLPQVETNGYITMGHPYDLPKIWVFNNYQYAGSMTWIKGRHTLKYGGDFLRMQYFSKQFGDTRGRMTFLGRFTNEPMAGFVLGYAQTTRRQLDGAGPYHLVSNYSGFVQDDYKITPSLTLNLGLRYELMKPPQEKFGAWSMFVPSLGKIVVSGRGNMSQADFDKRIRDSGMAPYIAMADTVGLGPALVNNDRNDFAPRLGFAWRPFGGAKTVIRGGYGLFYGSSSMYRTDEYSDTYPFSINESYSASSTNPLLLTVSNPYPDARRKVAGVTSTTGQDVNGRSQYMQSWNLTMEREFAGATALEIAYAGSKGTHLPRRYDINQPFRALDLKLPDGTFPRPYAAFQTINFINAGSNSAYNSGSVTVRRRFHKALFLRAGYVFAKSIDESSNTGGTIAAGFSSAQDARNLKGERGRSDFDIGHSFIASFIWQPRYTRNAFLRNWQMAGTTRAYTGQPFTPKVGNYSLDLGDAVRPDRIAKGTATEPSVDAWFDRAAFPVVPRGTYRLGSSGRNVLDGPGAFLLDLSLSRRFMLAERKALQFRWETFNVPNHTNLSLPETKVDILSGATISKAKSARTFQLGLRLEF